jgi:hypothetical protein
MERIFNMADIQLPSTSDIPSINPPSLPTVPSVEVKKPKLPVKTTKININTGKGVPGNFSASSLKSPAGEVSKLSGTLSSIGSKASTAASLIASPISGASKLAVSKYQKKLSGAKTAAAKKMAAAAKAPDFASLKTSLPTPPTIPSVQVPEMPTLPDVPKVEVPSSPNILAPSIPSVSGIA